MASVDWVGTPSFVGAHTHFTVHRNGDDPERGARPVSAAAVAARGGDELARAVGLKGKAKRSARFFSSNGSELDEEALAGLVRSGCATTSSDRTADTLPTQPASSVVFVSSGGAGFKAPVTEEASDSDSASSSADGGYGGDDSTVGSRGRGFERGAGHRGGGGRRPGDRFGMGPPPRGPGAGAYWKEFGRRQAEARGRVDPKEWAERKEKRRAEKLKRLMYDDNPQPLVLQPSALERLEQAALRVQGASSHRKESGTAAPAARSGAAGAGKGSRGARATMTADGLDEQGRELAEEWAATRQSSAYKLMLGQRERLPSWAHRSAIVDAVRDNQVVVISGETGCGKTTQVPQFILDALLEDGSAGRCSIVCTQPRRISAIGVADRVASERAEKLGDVVGYQIRLESRQSERTRLLFCTTGILLRRLVGQPLLDDVTHVIVDEIHERSLDSDFLLIVLRDLLPKRPDLRLILMSATLNAEMFSAYFGDAPTVHIPGFTYPVEQLFLEDALQATRWRPPQLDDGGAQGRRGGRGGRGRGRGGRRGGGGRGRGAKRESREEAEDRKLAVAASLRGFDDYVVDAAVAMSDVEDVVPVGLIVALLEHIDRTGEDGAVLVFLPGWSDISKLNDALMEHSIFGRRDAALVLPLHGSMPTAHQRAIFERPPAGVRKIVIATNIAETSITIDDVVFVIDSGLHKEKTYDVKDKVECLLPTFVSRASAKQRKGRAGRVQGGTCYHLFTRRKYEDELDDYQLPEMLRVPLEQLCLQIKIIGLADNISVREFLARAIEAPSVAAVEHALDVLTSLGALEQNAAYAHDKAVEALSNAAGRVKEGAEDACLPPAKRRLTEEEAAEAADAWSDGGGPVPTGGADMVDDDSPPEDWEDAAVDDDAEPVDRVAALPAAAAPPKPPLHRGTDAVVPPPVPTSCAAAMGAGGAGGPGGAADETAPGVEPEVLTPLGRHLAFLPMDPRMGKALVFGCLMGCIEPVLTITAALSVKSPFVVPLGKEKQVDAARRRLAEDSQSDHFMLLNAITGARECRGAAAREYCWRNFLSVQTVQMVEDMRRQFRELLQEMGFLRADGRRPDGSDPNAYGEAWGVVRAVLAAGLYPNVIRVDFGRKRCKLYTPNDFKLKPHPGSVNGNEHNFDHRWLCYSDKVRGVGGLFVYDTTPVPPAALALLAAGGSRGGALVRREAKYRSGEWIGIADWVYFAADRRTADAVDAARAALHRVFADEIARPSRRMPDAHKELVDTVAAALRDAPDLEGRRHGGRFDTPRPREPQQPPRQRREPREPRGDGGGGGFRYRAAGSEARRASEARNDDHDARGRDSLPHSHDGDRGWRGAARGTDADAGRRRSSSGGRQRGRGAGRGRARGRGGRGQGRGGRGSRRGRR